MTSASPKPKKRTAFLSKQRSAPSTMSKVGWKGLLQWPSAMSLLRNNREQELSSYSNNLHPSKERIYVLKYKDADDALGDDDASIQVWSSSSRDNAFSIHGQSHLSCRRSWSYYTTCFPTVLLHSEVSPVLAANSPRNVSRFCFVQTWAALKRDTCISSVIQIAPVASKRENAILWPTYLQGKRKDVGGTRSYLPVGWKGSMLPW